MNAEKVVKGTQEQAVASWIQSLNQLRINALLQGLLQQDNNLRNALEELDALKQSINGLIQTNRGGIKGMHGFIAERMQVSFENVRKLVTGAEREYHLIDDNGPVDYTWNGINYQQKFVESHLSLDAVKRHLEKYPDYIKGGGKYQIPKDYYERMEYLLGLSDEEAGRLSREDYRLWRYIKDFFENKGIDFTNIEPSVIDYNDVQRNAADNTISREVKNIRKNNQEIRDKLYQKGRPSSKELVKTSATAAAAEGGITFCMGVYKKRKTGKRLSEFDTDDWKELGIDTTKTGVKGGVRGASVYGMTNFTATPAAVACALVTATFGMIAEANKLKAGMINQEEFCVNSETLCLDVTISAVSSVLGEVIIPVPVLGAVIGHAAGMFMYGIAKEVMAEEEQKTIQQYNQSMRDLEDMLDKRYKVVWKQLESEIKKYDSLVKWAFSEDANESFAGSVQMAEYSGVSKNRILRNRQDIGCYFLA